MMAKRERESYENEVLSGGNGIDQRRRWRRGVESDRERGFV